MDTVIDEPATQETEEVTPELESTEETTEEGDTPEVEEQDTATLQKRLADKDRYIKELENKKKEKPDTRSKEIQELEWKLENKDRIALVKDEYEKYLVDGFEGEKVSKVVALELAEKQAKVDSSGAKKERQDDMTVQSVTNRNVDSQGYETQVDKQYGLTIEKKRKLEARHPHLMQ